MSAAGAGRARRGVAGGDGLVGDGLAGDGLAGDGSGDGSSGGSSGGVGGQLPRMVAQKVWDHLPTLLVLDLVLALAAAPAVALSILAAGPAGAVPPALLAASALLTAGVCLGPAWAATVAMTDRMVRTEDASIRLIGWALRRFGGVGVRLGGSAGVVAAVVVGTLALYRANPQHDWLLLPLFVDGTVVALGGLAGLVAFSLATTEGLRGRALLLCSLALVARTAVPVAGVVGLLVLVGFVGSLVPSLLVVLPGPLAVLLSAVVWRSRSRSRAFGC